MRNVFFVDSTGLDMMGQVQKMMKYQEDKKHVLFKNLVFVVKPRLFSLALQFCRSPVLLVYHHPNGWESWKAPGARTKELAENGSFKPETKPKNGSASLI